MLFKDCVNLKHDLCSNLSKEVQRATQMRGYVENAHEYDDARMITMMCVLQSNQQSTSNMMRTVVKERFIIMALRSTGGDLPQR